MGLNYVNGIPLTKGNIAFLKAIQQKDREERLAKIKNFKPATREEIERMAYEAALAEVQPKNQRDKRISHAARKARKVAYSIEHDPKNKSTKGK